VKWFHKKPPPLAIPPYVPPVKPVPPKEETYIVEDVDTTATGIFNLFGRRPKE
jgi:hypothetical protein